LEASRLVVGIIIVLLIVMLIPLLALLLPSSFIATGLRSGYGVDAARVARRLFVRPCRRPFRASWSRVR
jgi:hypothetical protein